MKKYFIITVLLISGIYSTAQQQVVPYTLADRDRLIQVEANINGVRNEMGSLRNEMNSLRNEMNAKFDAVNNRFDAVDAKFDAMNAKIDSIYWFLGVVVALIIFMLGFIIWDRRTTLAPINS
jgi:peptidoglycan hydrolase CwlO-like protein